MKVSLIGYGKMGKEVDAAARAMGIEVCSIVDPAEGTHRVIDESSMRGADVAIDFTVPSAVLGNVKAVCSLRKDLVVATTGWLGSEKEVKRAVADAGTGMIHSSNFSVGVNIYLKIIEEAARLFDRAELYDVFGYELHHRQKVDSPSGTARSIAEIILANVERKKRAVFDAVDRKIEPDELHFASVRAGFIPGTHVVGFDSEADTVEISHVARNRRGFALGALMAARWVNGRKGVFTMNDFMQDYFQGVRG
ncbi:4-hydroxy-tetrahydrodipicolinate reductase [Candidatus Woesearchaeota archaeon]|nr:4-hydroxy-tetrahydrodipicolinate reductase [Candidatus Woesearchaeota archaeon]